MALNQPHFLEKVTGFPFFSQCFLLSLYKPLCTEEGQKIRRRGALTVLFQHGTSFHLWRPLKSGTWLREVVKIREPMMIQLD